MQQRKKLLTTAAAMLLLSGGTNPVQANQRSAGNSLNLTNSNALGDQSDCPAILPPTSYMDPAQLITPIVDKTFMEKFIPSTNNAQERNDRRKIIDFIYSQMQLNENLRSYMQLVFTHLPDLNIHFFKKEELTEGSHGNAAYVPAKQTVSLPNRFELEKDFGMQDLIRHELRHAAMNAMQRTLQNKKTRDVECYRPEDEPTVRAYLKAGDQKVNHLGDLLKKEKKGDISKKEQELLDRLRRRSTADHKKNYQNPFTLHAFPVAAIEGIGKVLGTEFKPGATIDMSSKKFNFFPSNGIPLGLIRIEKIEDAQDKNNKKVTFTFQDPLCAAVHRIHSHQETVDKDYSQDQRLYERDAYLHGSIPQSLIKYLYPKLYSYTNQLILDARNIPVPYSKAHPATYASYQGFLKETIAMIMSEPLFFKAVEAPNYVEWAKYCRQNGNIEAAKTGLKTLIQQGHKYHHGEAHLELARIQHGEGNFKDAQKNFKIAEKKKANLSTEDRRNYMNLLKDEAPKRAKKMKNKYKL